MPKTTSRERMRKLRNKQRMDENFDPCKTGKRK